MSVEIKDLTGLEKPLTKLLEVVQAGVGKVYEPINIVLLAKANATANNILEVEKAKTSLSVSEVIKSAALVNIASDDEFIESLVARAQARIVHQEVARQKNIDAVVVSAVNSIPPIVSDERVDQDWLNRFFSIAAEVSEARMQDLWGKILAGEVASPGSYSIRTLNVLTNISKEEAEIFREACARSFGANPCFIPKIPKKALGPALDYENDDYKYGFEYSKWLRLVDAGLIQAAENTHMEIPLDDNIEEVFQGCQITFGVDLEKGFLDCRRIRVSAFTTPGSELRQLMENNFNNEYFEHLAERYKGYGVILKVDLSSEAPGEQTP